MTRLLLITAVFGLSASAAQACEGMRSANAEPVDKTTVASVSVPQSPPVVMSEPADKQKVETTTE